MTTSVTQIDSLPLLPEPHFDGLTYDDEEEVQQQLWTADQMREYARSALSSRSTQVAPDPVIQALAREAQQLLDDYTEAEFDPQYEVLPILKGLAALALSSPTSEGA